MRIKLFPQLRFLTPVTLRPHTTSLTSNVPLKRVFPFKLKYSFLGPTYSSFSTRPFSSETTSAKASKSLIEDEAELSDWVSDLRKGRFDDSDMDAPRARGRERGRSDKRRRESDDEVGGGAIRKIRGQFGSFQKNRFNREEFGGGEGESQGRFGSRRKEGNERRGGRERNVGFKKGKNDGKGRSGFVGDREEGIEFNDRRNVKGKMDSLGILIHEEDSDDVEESDGYDDLLKRDAASALGLQKEVSVKDRPTSPQDNNFISETRFDQCSISPLSLKATKDAGYERLTIVQEATLPVILKGKDILAKAKTGTGKTVAFLLPAIEVVLKCPPPGRDKKHPPILVLVVCPTRELALQARAEANTLLKYHSSIGAQVVIGGTRPALEQKQMQANPCQILVATPGRLKDHLENTPGFATRLMGLKVLVLDEADLLLDMGFRRDIEQIIKAVPAQRQTLLFSATVPEEVRQICHVALKRDHEFINTVEEGTEETHAQVEQAHLIAPLDDHFSTLFALLKDHVADNIDYKVLVFCTTAMMTKLVASLLGELKLNVREIHSRKPQSYRTRVSDEFRKSKGLILVTSDVSARGVDYPDVTLVIQVGVPADREQYIHRLGRTGRRGKTGQGILLLAPWEEYFLSTVKDLPISKAPAPLVDPDTKKKVQRALSNVEMKDKESAYQAWLGYYNSNKKVGKDKYRLVELANEFSRSMGLDRPPALLKRVLGKMGLSNVPGLRLK